MRDLKAALENKVRGKEFVRLGISDRCISIHNKIYNYHTGYKWNFIYEGSEHATQSDQCVLRLHNLTFSHLQIALVKTKSTNEYSFYLKNEPSSRKICTLDRRRRDILKFDMVNDKLVLARLKGDGENYWTLLDSNGNVKNFPKLIKEVFAKKQWESIQIKEIKE